MAPPLSPLFESETATPVVVAAVGFDTVTVTGRPAMVWTDTNGVVVAVVVS